ncbi:MAG: dihydrolipoyl dehydrogenase family protein, partial [Candidatus Dormibacteria bacterium]
MDRCDVLVLGGGAAAEALCQAGLGGRSVVVVEQGRFGGECPFVACMPSKAMLRQARLARGSRSGPRRRRASPRYADACRWRDQIAEGRDDRSHERDLRRLGVRTLRGRGRVVAPGRVEVAGRQLQAADLVLATGSQVSPPPIPGLAEAGAWTSDQLLSSSELPRSLAILGGGPVGCELAQILARFGCRVTVVEAGARLLGAEEPELAAAAAATLRADGVEVLEGVTAAAVEARGQGRVRLVLDGSGPVQADRLLVATGRVPALSGLGLEAYGLGPEPDRLVVEPSCQVQGHDHLWAIGDATGVAPFTHTADYQGRVVAANLRGEKRQADYRAIPRAVYLDPPVAAVGLTREAAAERGLETVVASSALAETARGLLEETGAGQVLLVADRARRVLVGAAISGPGADDLIGQAALAIRGDL